MAHYHRDAVGCVPLHPPKHGWIGRHAPPTPTCTLKTQAPQRRLASLRHMQPQAHTRATVPTRARTLVEALDGGVEQGVVVSRRRAGSRGGGHERDDEDSGQASSNAALDDTEGSHCHPELALHLP